MHFDETAKPKAVTHLLWNDWYPSLLKGQRCWRHVLILQLIVAKCDVSIWAKYSRTGRNTTNSRTTRIVSEMLLSRKYQSAKIHFYYSSSSYCSVKKEKKMRFHCPLPNRNILLRPNPVWGAVRRLWTDIKHPIKIRLIYNHLRILTQKPKKRSPIKALWYFR